MGTVAAYAEYVHKLQAVSPMPEGADFKLAFYGLREEIQRGDSEVHEAEGDNHNDLGAVI